jgi:hypothetical protein
MGFSLKRIASGIKNTVSDAANLGASIATKPLESVTGKNIVTPKFSSSGIGAAAAKIDQFNSSVVKMQTDVTKKIVADNGGLGAIAGKALPVQIVANADVQKLLQQADKYMQANTGISGGTNLTPQSEEVRHGIGKILAERAANNTYSESTTMTEPIIKIGAAPGAGIPTSIDVKNDLFGSQKKKEEEAKKKEEADKWYNKLWAWCKDPENLWAVITFPILIIAAIVWFIFGKKGNRKSKRRY